MGYRRIMRSGGSEGCGFLAILPVLLGVGIILGTALGNAKNLIGGNTLLLIGGAAYVGGLVYIAKQRGR